MHLLSSVPSDLDVALGNLRLRLPSPDSPSSCSSQSPRSLLSVSPSPSPAPSKPATAANPLNSTKNVIPPRPTNTNTVSTRRGLDSRLLESVVKLYVTHCSTKHIRPWQMSAQNYTTSSGFVLPDRLILTNAHSVREHTLVRVKRRACDVRYPAKVLAFSDECDLALLTVPDDKFWDLDQPLVPLTLGRLPLLRDGVIVAGYPHGGDGVSVTAGVVSRMELLDYSPAATLLSVQIDAAINPGNSGGPALDENGHVVGVAFRAMSAEESENIGYLIPPPVVRHFLNDVARHGKYTGFCATGFDWVDLEARAARRSLGLPEKESGILVRSVPPCSPARNILNDGDIVTHIDNTPVSSSGTVLHEESGERMFFHILVSQKFLGDSVELRVFRNRSFQTVSYKLPELNSVRFIPVHVPKKVERQYFVYGGCVFVALTWAYLRAGYGSGAAADSRTPVQLRWLWDYGVKKEHDEQVVILSHVLNAQLNIEYEHLYDERLHAVNGKKVRNLRQMVDLVRKCDEEFLKFELLEETIVLDRQEAETENEKILKMHHIPDACSFDNDECKNAEREIADEIKTETD